MPNIFDNLTDPTRLGPALRDSLEEFDSVDVATGYIDLRGWSNLADALDEKSITEGGRPTARVLVGMVRVHHLGSAGRRHLDAPL